MPIKSGKVKVLNNRVAEHQKVTPIARLHDNTTDIEAGVLHATQQFAHIRVPDDATGKRTRRGSLDSGSAKKFTGTVITAPPQPGL
jgi:hypothetical protein